ncbi:MAG: hypothetical protein AAB772_00915 [Patescibacteria group bacterium]
MKRKKRQFLEELKKAFDYSDGLAEEYRVKREQAMAEVNEIKWEWEKQHRLRYKNFLEQIIMNENLASGLRTWAVLEFNRIDNDDVIRLRRKQIKKMRNMIDNADIAVRRMIPIITRDFYDGKIDLSDSHTLSCLDNTKADLN